jgi:hypothetical protein
MTNEQGKIRIVVQALVDGEFHEVTAWVAAINEQAAVDKLFAYAKDGIGYKFLGDAGLIEPSVLSAPPIVNPYYSGRWYARV